MASFGVAPVFINIPLLETIDICVNILFQVKTCIVGWAAFIKEQFHELPTITMSDMALKLFVFGVILVILVVFVLCILYLSVFNLNAGKYEPE